MWSLTLASTVGVLAQMGSPQGARTPAPRLGFGLMKVKVMISGLTGVVDAAIKIPAMKIPTRQPWQMVKRMVIRGWRNAYSSSKLG